MATKNGKTPKRHKLAVGCTVWICDGGKVSKARITKIDTSKSADKTEPWYVCSLWGWAEDPDAVPPFFEDVNVLAEDIFHAPHELPLLLKRIDEELMQQVDQLRFFSELLGVQTRFADEAPQAPPKTVIVTGDTPH